MEAYPLPRPIGKRCIDPTTPIEAFVYQVEHSLESRRGKSPDKPRAGREAPIGPNQMLASRGHRSPYPRLAARWQALRLGTNSVSSGHFATGPTPRDQRFTVNGVKSGYLPLAMGRCIAKLTINHPRFTARVIFKGIPNA